MPQISKAAVNGYEKTFTVYECFVSRLRPGMAHLDGGFLIEIVFSLIRSEGRKGKSPHMVRAGFLFLLFIAQDTFAAPALSRF